MSSIMEALLNADYNLRNTQPGIIGDVAKEIARGQLNNAVTLLLKEYTLEDEIEPLLEKYGDVENVPEKE